MMANFDKTNYDNLKKTSGLEFWRLYELYKIKSDKEIKK